MDLWKFETGAATACFNFKLPSLLQGLGVGKEYVMEEGGLRRSARKKQRTLKAELNVATEVKFAEWKSWQGKGYGSGKEKPIAVDSEDDIPPKVKRRRTERSLRSREEISDLSEEEEREGTPLLTCKAKLPPMAEGNKTKSKQPQGRGRRKVNLEYESEDERTNGKEPGCPSVIPALSPSSAESNEGGECTKVDAPLAVGMDKECAEEGEEELPTEGCWSHFRDLCGMLPGRQPQIKLLLTLFGEPGSTVCPSLYVYGHSGTGKTLVLQTVLRKLELPHAFVNCAECYSSRLLYESVLNQLSGTVPCKSNGYASYARCDNMAAFLQLFQQAVDTHGCLLDQTVYIVLDRAERLREAEANVLPALLRLSQLCNRNVCVILISEIVWEKLAMDTFIPSPLPIHFPNYSKGETLAIMVRDCPQSHPLPFYQTFTHHIWNVFHSVCRDLAELRHLSSLLFPKYCEPVESGDIGSHEIRKLWRHIEPYFCSIMSRIYLRELSSSEWGRAQSSLHTNDPSSVKTLAEGLPSAKTPLELPHYSKFLLIAAYLASYNPAKSDKKFFSKQRQSRTRKSKKQSLKDKPCYQLLGPKAFPLDRLMAIFYSVIEDPVIPTADIYSQISTLVTLQLLVQMGSRDVLDCAKYKCLVTLDFIRHVARSVGFDVVQYLYDFT